MRKEILFFVCFGMVLVSLGFVSAGTGNTSVLTVHSDLFGSSSEGANFSSSITLNITFVNATDVIVSENGSGSIEMNISFWGLSSNSTQYSLGSTTQCANSSLTEWSCWDTFAINSTMDGLWTIMANITNISGQYDAEQDTDPFQNATAILFDSTGPSVSSFISPSWGAGTNQSGVLINLNVTVNDSSVDTFLDNASLYYSGLEDAVISYKITVNGVLNATYSEQANNSASNGSTQSFWIYDLNTSHLAEGTNVTITVWAYDSLNNSDISTTLQFTYDGTIPSMSVSQNSNSTYSSNYGTLTVSGGVSGVNGLCTVDRSDATVTGSVSTQYLGEGSLACGGTIYSYIVTCIDYSGNTGSSTVTMTTESCPGGTAGTAGSTTPTWTMTFVKTDAELSSQGITESLQTKQRVQVRVNDKIHSVGVISISGTSATIEIASDPVIVKLDVGEDAKVDVEDDGVYDLYIKLNGITGSVANLSIMKISENVPEGASSVETTGEDVTDQSPGAGEDDSGSNTWIWIVGIVVLLIAIGAGVAIKKNK